MNASIAANRDKVVLGVDDQFENVLMLQALIETQGFTFFGAGSGLECISIAQRISPRLILLDIQMPEMDGIETCKRLRSIWQLKQTPIAFVTGRNASDDVRAGIAAGGNDFVVKPFDPRKLLARVEYWTSRRILPAREAPGA